MKKNILSKIIISVIASFAFSACSIIPAINPTDPTDPADPVDPVDPVDPAPTEVKVTGVEISRKSATLKVGDAISLDATVSPSNATNKNVTWSISDDTIISFENNIVVALKEGDATITVTTFDGNFTDQCNIKVNPKNVTDVHVSSITLSDKTLELKEGENKTLGVTILPDNATNKNYSWSSSDSEVASIDNGKVTANKKGTATITVISEDGGLTDTCEVTVTREDIVNGQYLLNDYGDYVEYVDSSKDASGLKEDYVNLTKEKKYSSNDIFEAKYQVGLYEFFNIENKVDININISSKELNKLDTDYHKGNKESYRICNLDVTYLGLHFHFEEVGIRQKGNTSRGAILDGDKINLRHYKLSFEETFDDIYTETPKTWTSEEAKLEREDRKFFGADKIDIRWNRNEDKTYLKEYYAFEMHRNNGSLAPHSNPVHVSMSVDGSDQNLGVYLAVENINKGFIKRNFVKSARNGDLYKISWGSGKGAAFDDTSDNLFGVEELVKSGDGFYQRTYTYDLKTNKTSSDHSAIKAFINASKTSTGSTRKAMMQEKSIYDEFIAFTASLYIIGDPDDLRANCNNAYVYFAIVGDTTKIVFIPIDHDRAFGSCGDGGNPTGNYTLTESPFSSHLGYGQDGASDFFNKMIVSSNSTEIRADYVAKLDEMADSKWMTINQFEAYFNLVKEHYQNDLELGSRINYSKISLSLEAGTNLTGNGNLNMSTYLNTKRNYIKAHNW